MWSGDHSNNILIPCEYFLHVPPLTFNFHCYGHNIHMWKCEAFIGSAKAADDMLIDTGSVTTRTDWVVTIIPAETFGTDDETVMGGDITTGAITGREVYIPGSAE